MKLLKLKLPNGYKMLEKGFEINFLTKTKVYKDNNNDDLIELEKDFYYPKETIFVGKNSSGKSTVLTVIGMALLLLDTGRVQDDKASDDGTFDIEVIFYSKDIIYKYNGSFKKSDNNKSEFLEIVKESLSENEYKDYYKKDLTNVIFKQNKAFIESVGLDTSNIVRVVNNLYEFNVNISEFENYSSVFDVQERYVNNAFGPDSFIKLVNVFDDSIEVLKSHIDESGKRTDYYEFKRFTDKEQYLVTSDYLRKVLSSGTIRGVNLYAPVIIAFKQGGTIVVDELEKNFNKNLIGNLIGMINDPTINKANASIIYSTHYSELLDETDRCDNINVLHRDGSVITLKNMHEDYDTRTDLLKSNQFDQNAFDNNINFERLNDLKKILRK